MGRWSSAGLLQGISAGLIGVVVPLYLAECLGAANSRQGHGDFSMAADAWAFWRRPSSGCISAIVLTKSPNSATPINYMPSKTRPGAAFSGSLCLPEFCLSSAASWWPSRHAGCSVAVVKRPLLRHCSARAWMNRRKLSWRKWKKPPLLKKPGPRRGGGITKESLLAPKIRRSVCAGLRHSRLQSGHRCQFHHRLQRHHPDSGRAE
jgi:hypothetical protein